MIHRVPLNVMLLKLYFVYLNSLKYRFAISMIYILFILYYFKNTCSRNYIIFIQIDNNFPDGWNTRIKSNSRIVSVIIECLVNENVALAWSFLETVSCAVRIVTERERGTVRKKRDYRSLEAQ